MIKHNFVPINYPLYSNYRDKTGDGENFSLRIVGFDAVNEDGRFYIVPMDICFDGYVDEVRFCTRVHDISVTEEPVYKVSSPFDDVAGISDRA